MGTDGLLRFLREVQGEMDATLETASVLMEKQQQQQQEKQQQQQLHGLPQLQPRRKQEQQGLSLESFFDLLINASLNAAYSSGTVGIKSPSLWLLGTYQIPSILPTFLVT
jgi:hypothetical protein